LLQHPAAPAIAVIPFCLLTLVGFYLLLRFDGTPSSQRYAPGLWPETAGIAFPTGKPALLVFLHPLCPCSRATLEELNSVLSRVPKTALPQIHLIFVRSAKLRIGPEASSGSGQPVLLTPFATGMKAAGLRFGSAREPPAQRSSMASTEICCSRAALPA